MADTLHNLRSLSRMIYSCRSCGMCANKTTAKVPYVCPVREVTPGFDHFCARGKVVIARGLLEGALDMTPGLAEAAYSCTLCANCMRQCGATDRTTGEPLVDTVGIVEALRADFLSEHPEWVGEGYRNLLNASRQYKNPWAVPRSARERWCRGLNLPRPDGQDDSVLLFVGCTIASTPGMHELARKTVAILQRAGVRVCYLGRDEHCCGSVQRRIGARDMADAIRAENMDVLNATGCTEIVTLCAGCTQRLAHDYKPAGLKPRVTHIVAFLAGLLKQGRLELRPVPARTVCYHDPCHLNRHLGIYDPPRELLQAIPGITLVERTATGANTICCGAGGGMRVFEAGVPAQKIARTGLMEALQAGAEVMVSACPFCEMNLTAAADTLPEQIPVLDVIDLVYAAVEGRT